MLEESSFVCLLFYGHIDVRMVHLRPRRRARVDALEPSITLILLLCTQIMILTCPRRRVNTVRWFAVVAVASAEQAGGLAAAFEKIREGAAPFRFHKQHASKGRPRLARKEEEDGVCTANAAVMGRY